ncbi:MAG: hypothetical protein LBU32_02750 [Clostridiales bacterium]|nr:hypothetical protein [Clostridiales bacterium]
MQEIGKEKEGKRKIEFEKIKAEDNANRRKNGEKIVDSGNRPWCGPLLKEKHIPLKMNLFLRI